MTAHDTDTPSTDVIVVGSGLAGLVAACTALDRGRTVTLVEQEGPQSIGGQAFWSFGGLFLVDSPEQRRLGIHDSLELARDDWARSAGFDRDEDAWGRRWAEAYLEFAHRDLSPWLRSLFYLQPQPELMADVPYQFKLHIVVAFGLFHGCGVEDRGAAHPHALPAPALGSHPVDRGAHRHGPASVHLPGEGVVLFAIHAVLRAPGRDRRRSPQSA